MRLKLQEHKECLVCGTTAGLHLHHVFEGTANRRISDKYGCVVWLCGKHHNLSDEGIHFNKELDTAVKQATQTRFEEEIGTRQLFRQEFGKSYL